MEEFFWLYKERVTKPSYFLRGIQSDFIAVIIWGMATYSKPNNIFLILPVLILLTLRHQWVRALKVGFVFSLKAFPLHPCLYTPVFSFSSFKIVSIDAIKNEKGINFVSIFGMVRAEYRR